MPDKSKVADLDFISPPPIENGGSAERRTSLLAAELKAYSEFDGDDEIVYAKRVRYAFLARELKQIDDIVESRRGYANKIFFLVVAWLSAMGLIVLLVGWSQYTKFNLERNIILALVGGTTLNVLGIFTIVANFLFPKNGHSVFSRDFKIEPGNIPPKPSAKRKPAKSVDISAYADDADQKSR